MSLDIKEYHNNLKASSDYLVEVHKEFRIDFRFFSLHQWEDADTKKLKAEMRPALTFDLIRPTIKSISGAEITNRYMPTFEGFNLESEDQDRRAADLYNYIYTWARTHGGFEHQESLAFQDLSICGLGCTDTFMEYGTHPDGQILVKRFPVWNAGFDPSFTEPNIQDREWCYRLKDISVKEFKGLFGEEAEEVLSELKASPEPGAGLGRRLIARLSGSEYKFDAKTASANYMRGYDSTHGTVRLFDYQWREKIFRDRLVYADGRDEWYTKEEAESVLKEISEINATNRAREIEEAEVPTLMPNMAKMEYFKALVAGDNIMSEQPINYGGFTLNFMTGEEDWSDFGDTYQGRKKFFGLVRCMRDPQTFRNKFLSQGVHIWNSNPKGVLLYEDDLFKNDQSAMDQWSSATGSIEVESGALSGVRDKFKHITPSMSFAGVEPMLRYATAGVHEASGVSPAYFGGQASDLKRTAHSSITEVISQSMSSLSTLFDALSMYRKENASLVISMARQNLSRKTLERVVGLERSQYLDLFDSLDIQEYDIVVKETPQVATPSQDVFQSLIQNVPAMIEAGIPIPPSLFRYALTWAPPEVGEEWERMMRVQQEQQNNQPPEQPPTEGSSQ